MELAKITARGQTTIPKSIREAANLDEGDVIAFEIEGDHLLVHKVTPRQDDYLTRPLRGSERMDLARRRGSVA